MLAALFFLFVALLVLFGRRKGVSTLLSFQYRQILFSPAYREHCLITGATLGLRLAAGADIRERMRAVLAQRRARQPLGMPSAGSFFKNPPGDYAGRLIERAGLKGYSHGQAMVSPRHGNIIVNRGGASPEDIILKCPPRKIY